MPGFLSYVEGGMLHVHAFSEVSCVWKVFSYSPDFLACFASGCTPLPISVLQKVIHAFPWHNIHSTSLENVLQPQCLHCYNLPLPDLSLTRCISANLWFWALAGPLWICYDSRTRASSIPKSQLPLIFLSLNGQPSHLTLLRRPRLTQATNLSRHHVASDQQKNAVDLPALFIKVVLGLTSFLPLLLSP